MLMGAPTEIYLYGTLYWLVCVAIVFVALAANYIYLPVFYELQLTSTYEVCSTMIYHALLLLIPQLHLKLYDDSIPTTLFIQCRFIWEDGYE